MLILQSACRRLYNWIKVAPYQSEQQLDDDEDDDDASHGLRVMGVGFSTDREEAAYCACIDGEGDVTDFMRMVHLLQRRSPARGSKPPREKERELEKLKEFILKKRPHVIAVGAESREALMVMEDLRQLVSELEQEHQMAPIGVELVDNELARVYGNCNKGQVSLEFPPYPLEAFSFG